MYLFLIFNLATSTNTTLAQFANYITVKETKQGFVTLSPETKIV